MRVRVSMSVCVNTCVCWGHVEGKKDANSSICGRKGSAKSQSGKEQRESLIKVPSCRLQNRE